MSVSSLRTLSFDTSTSSLHICLTEGKDISLKRIVNFTDDNRQFAASAIVPVVSELFKESGWQKSDLELIVVGIGPGSFTGIRVAVVTARALAQALNLPLIGINGFECIAYEEKPLKFPTALLLNAGKNQMYCAHIDSQPEKYLHWDMQFHHIHTDDLHSHLEQFQSIHHQPKEDELEFNLAVIQSLLVHQRLAELTADLNYGKGGLLSLYPYQQINPLYIRNASVTIKSSL